MLAGLHPNHGEPAWICARPPRARLAAVRFTDSLGYGCLPRLCATCLRSPQPASRTGRRRIEHRRPCLGPAYADAPVRPGPADPGSITVIRVPVDAGVAPWAIAAPGAPSIVRARVPRSTAKQWHPRHLVRRADRRLPYSARAVGEHGRRTVSALRVKRQRQSPAARCHLPSIDEAEGVVAFSSGDGRRLLIVDDRGGYAVFDYPEAAQ
jgi:hypothetical protein